MSDLKQLAAITALNNMMQGGHLSICTIDVVAKLLGVDPKGEAYDILRPLHCVDFAKMPGELKAAIPSLIKACLSVEPTYQFPLPAIETTVEAVREAESAPQRRGIMRLLGSKT